MPGTEKTQHISLTTQVENRLKHQLSIGALKPGARLITKNIAQELGVSITPVREALLRLVSSSALAVAPAQAFMVPEISLESLLEINTIRTALEEMAVVAAAGKITPDREQALESGVMEKILLANRAFRFEIYHYADMPTLYAMIEQLWVRLGPSLHFLYDNFKLDDYQNGVNLYRKLLNALVTGDKEASRHCLQNVLQQNVATIKNQYFM
ncbi:putative DNA-binding transcriptional regulator [Salmonella enterica subsp. enterica serovar Typhimurium str. DT104]|uniref:colanic acid/biofilm transcriptional regulator McbR n=1 Tax=Salmonella enterica TaxID=28901 RepID=UPI0005E58CB6|nr:colanic acid/biofilm transcriptional regulator McbR [Salmonella enterica]CQE52429.1 putative DNA-binding transcriptional regulator [Salmonella enterica subsp. enterica serovar Typhimurium str. DT104]